MASVNDAGKSMQSYPGSSPAVFKNGNSIYEKRKLTLGWHKEAKNGGEMPLMRDLPGHNYSHHIA